MSVSVCVCVCACLFASMHMRVHLFTSLYKFVGQFSIQVLQSTYCQMLLKRVCPLKTAHCFYLHLHWCIYQTLLSKATYSAFRLYLFFCQYVWSLRIAFTVRKKYNNFLCYSFFWGPHMKCLFNLLKEIYPPFITNLNHTMCPQQ